jgi:hypothetical protein
LNKKLFVLFPIILFCLKFLETLTPYSHGDPLYYHLVLGKLWSLEGFKLAHLDTCGAMQAGFLEYIFGIVQFIIHNKIYIQLISQEFHFLLSIGIASLFFLYRYIKDSNPAHLFLSIGFLTIGKGSDFFLYAKNDGFMALLAFICTYLVVEKKLLNKFFEIILLAFVLIMIALIKINGILFVIILNSILVWNLRKDLKKILLLTFSQMLFISPLFYRNWYFLKSPFFPALIKKFPGNLSNEMIANYTFYMGKPLTLENAIIYLKLFFLGKYLFILIPILIFLNIKNKHYKLNQYLFISMTYLILLMLQSGGGLVYERWIFGCFFINLYYVITSLFSFNINYKYGLLLLFVLMIDSKIDLTIKRIKSNFVFKNISEEEKIIKTSSNNQIWKFFPNESSKTQYIISDQYNQIFYAPDYLRLHSSECNIQGHFLDQCHNESDLKELSTYKYAILIKDKKNTCYQSIKNNWKNLGQLGEYSIYEQK